MKKIFFISFFLLFFCLSVNAANSPLDVLKQYYEADMAENIDVMMSLTDFSSMGSSQSDQFRVDTEKTLKALALVFNTKYYEISDEKVLEGENDAYVFYHLKNQIEDDSGKTLDEDMDYVAVMRKTEGVWKIVYMQPKVLFEQNNAIRNLTVGAGISLSPTLNLAVDGEKTKNHSAFLWIMRFLVVFILALSIVAIVFFLKKNKELKFKKKALAVGGLIFVTLIVLLIIFYYVGSVTMG